MISVSSLTTFEKLTNADLAQYTNDYYSKGFSGGGGRNKGPSFRCFKDDVLGGPHYNWMDTVLLYCLIKS